MVILFEKLNKMATLNTLLPMVDLAFLLITFFMLTLPKMKVMANLNEMQHQILQNKKRVAATHVNLKDKEMLVIIKPTDKSTCKNFVDMIDEMHILGIESYNIDDKRILAQENTFMNMKGI